MVSLPIADTPCAADALEFVFREVRSAHEMQQVLALRYEIYERSSGTNHHASLDGTSRLDVDAYDTVSRHFGLFARWRGRESVAGTLRLVTGRTSPQVALLHACCAAHDHLARRLAVPPANALPMLGYLDAAQALEPWLRELRANGELVAEAGRFAIEPRVLAEVGRAGIRLSHHVVLSAIASACEQDRVDRVVISAEPFLARLYSSFGFAPVPCAPAARCVRSGVRHVVLHATPEMVPAAARALVAERARQLRATGECALRLDGGRPLVLTVPLSSARIGSTVPQPALGAA